MNLILKTRQSLGGDLYLFTFQPTKPITWRAGQQVCLTVEHEAPDPLGKSRYFSIASAPFEHDILILTHCNSRASTFKKALLALQPGETVTAQAPDGNFVITHAEKEYTLIAAGVGIAPYRAMLLELDHLHIPITCTLLYSHTSTKFPFKEELETLLKRNPGFKIFYTIDPGQLDRGGVKEIVTGLENSPIYMSGIYIRKIATMLDSRDVAPQKVVHAGTTVSSESEAARKEEEYLRSLWGE